MCQKSGRQTKPANFGTFWQIFQDPVHIFQNRFLRWNRELKPVVLSTMNPINGTNFFLSYKGGGSFLKSRTPQLKPLKIEKTIFLVLPTFFWPTNLPGPLYNSKKKLFRLWASWYSKRPAWAHGFNAKNGFEKNASGPEILAKKSQNNEVWFGDLNFGTFWPISWDPMRFFRNRFLRWNRELKPVVWSP